ncbi:MAG: type II toxin-antitoxin system VapC family toxin [Chloroflexi bacterium]|nr:type II toxin-antitoxin system VapC family toxin [Chloroflexota bacterium]
MIMLDTSALLYLTLDRQRLTQAAAREISEADRIAISSISIWEIGVKVGKGNLTIPLPVRDFAERLEQVDRIEVLPVDVAIWLRNVELEWEHRDPADRTIVATAEINDCPLVTSDATIRAFYPKVVW